MEFESVKDFKYLGSVVERIEGSNNAEIDERLKSGNKCYFSMLNLFKSNYITRKTKIKLYKTLIRPVVSYGCETWSLRKNKEEKLDIFERKILRRILGSVRTSEGLFRLRTNEECIQQFKDLYN